MKCVYIAGPLSLGSEKDNVRKAMEAGALMLDAGYAPYVPHAAYFSFEVAFPRGDEAWIQSDLAWVAKSDMVLRLPGPSAGADRETAIAAALNIPVFFGTATQFLSRTRDA